MCGHMSHKKSDDYKLRSGIVADDLETFVEEFSGGCSPEEYYDACHYLTGQQVSGPGLEVIKLEYSLRLKIKRYDWLLAGF